MLVTPRHIVYAHATADHEPLIETAAYAELLSRHRRHWFIAGLVAVNTSYVYRHYCRFDSCLRHFEPLRPPRHTTRRHYGYCRHRRYVITHYSYDAILSRHGRLPTSSPYIVTIITPCHAHVTTSPSDRATMVISSFTSYLLIDLPTPTTPTV